jgi:hypothetical protein
MAEDAPTTDRKRSRSAKSADDKLRIVLAAERLAGDELGALLRREGVHTSELESWRASALEAAAAALSGSASKPAAGARSAESKRVKELERELRRKDKALAEAAALLVLQKKVRELWGGAEDAIDERIGR